MAVIFAPQQKDPNADVKYYMMQMAQLLGGRRRETGDLRDVAKYGQYQQQLSAAETLQQSLMGQTPEARQQYQGPSPQWPAFQAPPQMQTDFGVRELAKRLDPLYQARTKYYESGGFYGRRQTGGVKRGTLPWYQWPEYKGSPAAKRARGEKARVTKPFGPSSTRQMAEDIESRISLIKEKGQPQRGPGAGKWGGPDYAQSDILSHYIEETEIIGYRSLSAAQQRQFDALWDTKMRRQKDFVWKRKSKEVRAVRRTLRAGRLPAQAKTEVKPPPEKTAEPQSVEEFNMTVTGITDDKEAQAYYDKWISLWRQ